MQKEAIFKRIKNKISENEKFARAEAAIPEGMWTKCVKCGGIVLAEDLQENMQVCSLCEHHFMMTAMERVYVTADSGSFKELYAGVSGCDPLDFPGYNEKIDKLRVSGSHEAVICGEAKIEGNPCVLCIMDGTFLMGSMGMAVGEKLARAVEHAVEMRLPLIIFTVSGGARMQEGIVSLMQMAKVSGAISLLDSAGLLYITVITDPTTGGVTASFASLGDIIIAEPGALIGFAGKRVIEQTIKQKLPEEFQRAEFMLEKGFIDMIVHRKQMKETLGKLLKLHGGVDDE